MGLPRGLNILIWLNSQFSRLNTRSNGGPTSPSPYALWKGHELSGGALETSPVETTHHPHSDRWGDAVSDVLCTERWSSSLGGHLQPPHAGRGHVFMGHPGSWLDRGLPLDLQFGFRRSHTPNWGRRPRGHIECTLVPLEGGYPWDTYHEIHGSLPAPVARWRHWKPRQLQETDPITQRQLEKELRLKWAQRLICLLAPFADKIPNMASVMGKDQEREWIDLLGDTRFRTLRIHCLALENLQAQGFSQVPWTEADVRDHLNRMRGEEASPHKIQRVWETLRWFSKRFGFLKIDACERLMEKKKTLQEEGVDTVARPQRKAILPTKEVIWTLEEVAAGPGPTPAQSGEGPSPVELLDQYICGVVACSARFNDLQHTIPTAYKFHGGTIELQAWQSKTVSAFRSKKSPVPLLAPTYSFTGRDWWTPLMRTWDKMKDLEKFKDLDYIIPTLSKDSTGIIPRPSAADGALRWLKAALHRNWSTVSSPDILHKLTWHSFRVFVPDCAYQLGFPRDQRQYLGNWTTETTADIYTRDKRNVVEKVWKAVGVRWVSSNWTTPKQKEGLTSTMKTGMMW